MDRSLRNPFGSYLVTGDCTLRAKSYATSAKKATGLQLTVAQGNKLRPGIGKQVGTLVSCGFLVAIFTNQVKVCSRPKATS